LDPRRSNADFGNEEYKSMVCVESGNVAKNRISLLPGRNLCEGHPQQQPAMLSTGPAKFNPL